ncbi:hypothetical protein Q5P01_017170 [Channa striata]|uniref:Ig-like domain-containing protein n=1 Tax=Channa striata TaxID=64152 RepID=A0AA88MAX4_CHASR|nr:hypothetical protein Q5P01_017170 [Channa striata]
MWLFIIGVFIACAGKHVDASCPVVMKPPVVVVGYGKPFSVNCTSLSNKTDGMGWESSAGGTELRPGVTSVPLNIEAINQWSLEPTCYMNDKDGGQCSAKLPITVYKMPDLVTMSQPSPPWPMVEGEKYLVKCDVANVAPARNLTVQWYKSNKMFHMEPFDETTLSPVNKTSVLHLTAHRDDDGTQIWCEANLNFYPFGPNFRSVTTKKEVTVLYPPTFTKPANETVEVNAKSKLLLNCTAAGNPAPVYSWQCPQPIQQTDTDKSQAILDLPLHLPGTYSCTASNSQGINIKHFIVIEEPRNRTTLAAIVAVFLVLGAVLFIAGAENNMANNFLRGTLMFCMFYSVSGEGCSLILKPSRVVVAFGEPVSVSCEATRPVRVLGWESVISATHTQQDLSVHWKVDSLIDWIEEPICYGVFFTAPRQCEEKLNLVLYKTPDSISIRPVNHTGPMTEGKEYQLLCEVQNIAPVQYLTLRWYRGQTEVYNHSFSDLTSSSPVQVSSTLIITPTKAENGAQYRCVAELDLGPEGPQPPPAVTSEPLNASVYFPPMFLSPEPEVLDLIVGAEITLNCTATGNPTPVYSWLSSHPVQERIENEAVLTSSTLIPGAYTCIASNTLEKKSKQFLVKSKTKGV